MIKRLIFIVMAALVLTGSAMAGDAVEHIMSIECKTGILT